MPLSPTAGAASPTIVLSVLADLERRVNVDRDRVFVAGYSRGGNAARYFAVHWPDLWAGVAPASGYDPVERDTWPDLSRAVDGDLGGTLLRWMATRVRDALPDDVEYTLRDPRHRGAYWLEVVKAKDTVGTRPVVIGRPGDPTAETFPVHRRLSWAPVRRTGPDEVVVDARNVAELRLHVSPARFDLDRPLTVRAGGRTRTLEVVPTVGGLVRRFRRDRDRSRLFPSSVDLRL